MYRVSEISHPILQKVVIDMAKKKSKKTPKYVAEYKKELANLRKRIRYAYKEKGLIFEELPIPATPEKIRKKDINKLKSLRGEKLWKHATVKQYEDVRDEEEYQQEESRGYVSKESLYNLISIVSDVDTSGIKKEYNKERAVEHGYTLYGILTEAISTYGEDEVARRVDNHSPEIMELAERYIYAYKEPQELIESAFNLFIEYINDGAMTPTQAQSIDDGYGWS